MLSRKLMLSAFLVVGISIQNSFAGPCPNATPTPTPPVPSETYQNLGAIRAALSQFYGDTEGRYPLILDDKNTSDVPQKDLVPKYLKAIPPCSTYALGTKSGVEYYSGVIRKNGFIDVTKIKGTGKWGYVNDPTSIDYGFAFVDVKTGAEPAPDKINNLGNLGSLRAALSIYIGDLEGVAPPTLAVLQPKYIYPFPGVVTCAVGYSTKVTIFNSLPKTQAEVKGTGGWGYVPTTREIFIDSKEDNLWKN